MARLLTFNGIFRIVLVGIYDDLFQVCVPNHHRKEHVIGLMDRHKKTPVGNRLIDETLKYRGIMYHTVDGSEIRMIYDGFSQHPIPCDF